MSNIALDRPQIKQSICKFPVNLTKCEISLNSILREKIWITDLIFVEVEVSID